MGMFGHGRVHHERGTVRGRPGSHCHPDPFGKAQGQVHRRISRSRRIVHLGIDSSPQAQNDKVLWDYLSETKDLAEP